MELREKIAEICGTYMVGSSLKTAATLATADAILALPEIAEALLLYATAMRRYGEALRPAEVAANAYLNASPLAQFVTKDDLPNA